MNAIQNLVEITIKTNERQLDFVSLNGMVFLKQTLDDEVSSVVLSKEELDIVAAMPNLDNPIASFMSAIAESKAM